ncbi:hypothetical protein N9260_01755 [bacterium]|nr:hypothetical protein [bacterium]
MSKRKKRRKPNKAQSKNPSQKGQVAEKKSPTSPSLAAEETPSPIPSATSSNQNEGTTEAEEALVLRQALAPEPAPAPVLDDFDEDLELDTEGMDLSDPRDTRGQDFNVVPRATEAEQASQREDEKAARIDLAELAPGIEIPETQEEETGGLVDFLETPTQPKARRVQFLPEDHIEEPRYLPDDLLVEEGAKNTSEKHSEVWGKVHADTPSFNKFDETEAIKEELRAVPMLGKTIISEQLRVRRRAWKWVGLFGIAGAFVWGICAVDKGVKHSEKAGSAEVSKPSLGLYEPAAVHSIDELLDRYFSAKTVTERLPYIRATMQVRPIMEAYELENGPEIYSGFTRDTVKAPAPYLDTAFFTVDVTLEPTYEKRRLVIERRDDNTYLLDWENLVGYQHMIWDAFTKARPTEPQAFSAVVLPSDYYNFHFSDPREWMGWRIRHPAKPDLDLYGYTRVDSNMTDQFLRETSTRLNAPDTGTAVTLRLAYPEGASDLQASQVEIVEVIKRGWISTYE